MQSIQLAHLDVEELRRRLKKMSDSELRKFGKAARYMVSPTANMGKPPLPAFMLQLEEARAEWRKRHAELKLVDHKDEESLGFSLLTVRTITMPSRPGDGETVLGFVGEKVKV
jgi:hypothetical protein